MAQILSRIQKALKLRIYKRGTWEHSVTLAYYDFPGEVSFEGSNVLLKRSNLRIPAGRFRFIFDGFGYFLKLNDKLGAGYECADDRIYVTFRGLRFELQTAEDLFILNEIYVNGSYAFALPETEKPVMVIDIGMNVAFGSVYFSKCKGVDKVFAFEPFKPTYEQALRHIEMNGAGNVIPHNYGLGIADSNMEVAYSPAQRGQVGIWGTKLVFEKVVSEHKEQIVIRSAKDVLDAICAEYGNAVFVLKIDCEGAEYEILEALEHASIWDRTAAVMIEWHLKGPDKLLKQLAGYGFATFSLNPLDQKAGMIYAVKQGGT